MWLIFWALFASFCFDNQGPSFLISETCRKIITESFLLNDIERNIDIGFASHTICESNLVWEFLCFALLIYLNLIFRQLKRCYLCSFFSEWFCSTTFMWLIECRLTFLFLFLCNEYHYVRVGYLSTFDITIVSRLSISLFVCNQKNFR